jgi:hypothetical protein
MREGQLLKEGPANFHAILNELAAEYDRMVAYCSALQDICPPHEEISLQLKSARNSGSVRDSKQDGDVVNMPGSNAHETRANMQELNDAAAEKATFDGLRAITPIEHRGHLDSVDGSLQELAQERVRKEFMQMGTSMTWRSARHLSSRLSGMSGNHILHQQGPWLGALDPNSQLRLMFECMTMICCIHDAMYVPYSVAWSPAPTLATTIVRVVSMVIWWSEMGLNFFTGYYKEGLLVRDVKLAAIQYLSTLFIVDIFINAVDLVTFVMEMETNDTSTGTTVLRAVRIAKLSRLARIIVIFNRLHERVKSWDLDSNSFTLVGLGVRLIAILFLLNHLICCGWYLIGTIEMEGDTGRSWLDMSIKAGTLTYRKASPTFQYLTSLHWSFTQMTPGSMSVVPQNSVERCWNVMCLIIGLFVSALLISQLSAKMVRVQSMNSVQLQQMEMLGRFLVEQDVPRPLSQRIRRHVREKTSVKKPLTIADLPSLELLPITVRQELCCALFARTMLSHSVFYTWCISDDSLIEDLAFRAFEVQAYTKNDDVFVPLQEAKRALFLRRGEMQYRREIFTTAVGSGITAAECPDVRIAPKEWISTIAVFCNWNYVGRLLACETCDAISLRVPEMLEVLESHPQIFQLSLSYATTYSILANSSDPEYASRVDLDLSPARILLAMPLSERLSFATPLIRSFADTHNRMIERHFPVKRPRTSQETQQHLMDEMEIGKCVVTLGNDSHLLRTVVLCVMEITNDVGKLLVQVASWKNGQFIPDIALPGTKLREKESTKDAAKRLIKDDLPDLRGSMHFDTSISKEYEDVSKKNGVRSKYLKTTFFVRHSAEDERSRMCGATVYSNASAPNGAPASEETLFSRITAIEACNANDKIVLFAWVRHDEFRQMSLPSHEAGLKQWLSMFPGPGPRVPRTTHEQVSLVI